MSLADLVPASFRFGAAWHVVRTNVNCENRARLGIEALGIMVYCPMEHKLIAAGRRRVRVARPLFVRYLFARFDIERQPWCSIRNTTGVESILCSDPNVPSRVPDDEIKCLQRAEEIGMFDKTKENHGFGPGDKVSVEDGPFAGFVAEVLRSSSKDRVEVLLRLFNGPRRIQVASSMLRAL